MYLQRGRDGTLLTMPMNGANLGDNSDSAIVEKCLPNYLEGREIVDPRLLVGQRYADETRVDEVYKRVPVMLARWSWLELEMMALLQRSRVT